MNPTSRVKIEVCGAKYYIASTEPETYVKELGAQLNAQISDMLSQNNSLSVTDALIDVYKRQAVTCVTYSCACRNTAAAPNIIGGSKRLSTTVLPSAAFSACAFPFRKICLLYTSRCV